jgi:hypothetical protein
LSKRLIVACDYANVEQWEMYDLRRRFVNLVRNGYGPEVEAAIVGHSQAVAQRYYLQRDIALAKQVIKEIG